jgi:arabinogalactan endo-1,4-beta-galactosidase
MIDFHYSNHGWSWQQQFKLKKAWENHTFPELMMDVYDHTWCFEHNQQELPPEWVQVGNEIPGGNDVAGRKY